MYYGVLMNEQHKLASKTLYLRQLRPERKQLLEIMVPA